jgi:hypothetical protein
MTITFRCPNCDKQFRTDVEVLGKKIMCPNAQCRSTIHIPATESSGHNAPVRLGERGEARRESRVGSATDLPSSASQSGASFHVQKLPLLLGGLSVMALCLAAIASVFPWTAKDQDDPFSDLVSKAVSQSEPPVEREKETSRASEEQKEGRDLEKPERLAKLAEEVAAEPKKRDENTRTEKPAADLKTERVRQDAMAKAALEPAFGEHGPFTFIRIDHRFQDSYGQWLFELPPPELSVISEALPLLTRGLDVELSLCKAADPLFADSPTKLELLQSSDAQDTWSVVATQSGTRIELGEYALESFVSVEPNAVSPDHQLKFRWRRDAAREILAAELLRWWPLQISVGDRSAVLLQRSTHVSDVPLKWDSLVNGQKITFPRSSEIQAFEHTPNSLLSFCVEIQELDLLQQTVCLDLGNLVIEENELEPTELAAVASTNFPLMLPLKFQERVPAVHEAPLGFGRLHLQVSRTPKEGLVVQPKLELVLRLPGNKHLETFPSEESLGSFKAIARDPELIRNLPSESRIRSIAEQATQQTRDNHEFWHRQPMRALAKSSSFDPVFVGRAQSSMKTVRQIVRTAERDAKTTRNAVTEQQRQMSVLAGRMNQSGGAGFATMMEIAENGLAQLQQQASQAEARLEAARRLGPAIERYCEDLSELIGEFAVQHASLMQDYEAISLRVEELLEASRDGAFKLRAEMSALIQIPQTENGPTIRIYFIEVDPNTP